MSARPSELGAGAGAPSPTPLPAPGSFLGSRRGSWRPLLGGAAAAEALEAVAEVAATLAAPGDGTQARDFSLGSGGAGIALLYAYLDRHRADPGLAATARRHLDEAATGMGRFPMDASLYGGCTGIGWAVRHLGALDPEIDADAESFAELDQALLQALETAPWPAGYDLISGLAGLAVYALEAPSSPQTRQILARIVDVLAESAVHGPAGCAWETPAALIPAGQLRFAPQGYFNLGVAHGIPGLLPVLAACCRLGIRREKSQELAEGTVEWLLAQQLNGDFGSAFPPWVSDETPPGGTRLAWCYGDLGVATALFVSARCLGEGAWESEALRIAELAARRSPENAGAVDGGLCHGTAGLAHLFNRLYQATGEELLGDAARRWFRLTLSRRRPGEGIAGFSSWRMVAEGEGRWVADPAFLTGASGIALALLAAISPVAPDWDRLLLASA